MINKEFEFIEPEMEIIKISATDIICASGDKNYEDHEAKGIEGWMF